MVSGSVGTDCSRRHVVVTGASSGMGRATALRMAAAGWHVFAGVRRDRDGQALTDAATGSLTPVRLDVTRPADVAQARLAVAEHVGAAGLDGLINNAGIGMTGPTELLPLADFRRLFEVNVIGQIAVIQAFLPALRRASGRIVLIGSIGRRITVPFGAPIAETKSAIKSLADALRLELAPWNIRVVLLEPASIHTEAADKVERAARQAADSFPPEYRDLYADTYLGMIARFLARERRGSRPEVVADRVSRVLAARRPRACYLVGKDSWRLAALGRLPTPVLDAVRRRLFGLPRPGSLAAGGGG